jgi:hypothetical protein
MKDFAAWLVLAAITALIGFGLASGVLFAMQAVFPPYRPEGDDTFRQFVDVASAYVTWAVVTVGGSVIAWRMTHRRAN